MNKKLILLLVSCVMLMESIDTTVINTSIPLMARYFNVHPIDLKIALISYLLSLAICLPISGWVADKFGLKSVFIAAIAFFTVSSIGCGFSTNLETLVIARVLQGLGGSLTVPLGRLIIMRTWQRHELVSKMSVVVMIASLGLMLGPVIGGFITEYSSWRWIFWVNAPIGFLTLLLALKILPKMPPFPVQPLDKLGFVLFGSALACLTFGLSALSESAIKDTYSVMIIITSFVLLFLYKIHTPKVSHPIVKMDLLNIRTFKVAVIGNLLGRLGFGGIPFLLPLLFQICLGYSATLSGLLLAPIALGVLLVKPLSLSILRFFGYKRLLLLNTILVGFALASFSLIDRNITLLQIGILTFFYGFLMSLQYTGMNSLAYANVNQQYISDATSIMSTIQQLSQSFGVAIAAILLRFFSYKTGTMGLTFNEFHRSFLILALLTLASGSIFITLKKEDGHELLEGIHLKS